ncbi:MAG: molybdenum cofactor guanylyltransferase [Thermoanaerobaculales bacterium]|jgi:molybdopterin-guanine dinucleotide biosynthesis protein A|nr:molybdenum cofactor guanylyltransferase [Thermoanaerobaculales bacterium]
MREARRGALPHLMAGVLIGGGSRRMGRPKQLIGVSGATMAGRAAAALAGHADDVVLLGGGVVPPDLGRLPRLADAAGCQGPIAGVLAGLRAEPACGWIVAACDMPLVEPAAVAWLVGERRPDAIIVFPVIDGRVEPLLALYEPACRPLLELAAARRELALHRLARHPGVRCVEPPAGLRRCWLNANTPADLLELGFGS